MELLCKVCDEEIIENESEYKMYMATLRKTDDKTIYKIYVNNNVNLDEVDKILIEYVSTRNKKIDFCFVYCELKR